jgi:DNA-binding transcriptional LysR family regulator
MNQWLNLNLLLSFMTVVQEGGIGRAAKRLGLSQPALSNQIKQLEGSLDCELFNRTPQGIRLTETGETVLEYARSLVAIRKSLLSEVKTHRDQSQEQFRIGVSTQVQPTLLVEMLRQRVSLHGLLGQARIQVVVDDDTGLFDRLQSKNLEMAIVGQAFQSADKIELIGSIELPVRLFMTRKFFEANLLQASSNSSTELIDQLLRGKTPFLLPSSRFRLRKEIDEYFQSRHASPRTLMESDRIDVISHGMLHQFGAAFLPDQYIPFALAGRRMKVLGPPAGLWKHTLWLYSKKGMCTQPLCRGFRDALMSAPAHNQSLSADTKI